MNQNPVIKLLERAGEPGLMLEALAIGKFHPERVPTLDIRPFSPASLAGPMKVSAAVSPDCSFRLLKEVVEAATESLDIYIYNVSADHIVKLLRDAGDRGVQLRVMYDSGDGGPAEKALLEALPNTDVRVAPMSRPRAVFSVCHQKFVVADGKRVLMGSANWAGTSMPNVTTEGQFKKGNREWIIAIESAEVAQWFGVLFQTDWDIPEFADAPHLLQEGAEPLPEILVPSATVRVPDTVFAIKRLDRAVQLTPLLSPDNYFSIVEKALSEASASIEIEQQYIIAPRRPDGSVDTTRRVNQLLALLQDKKAAGITVRIIVSPKFSWDKSVDSLTEFGLEENLRAINLDFFTHLHNKGLIIDGKQAVVSSTNWSENSITQAREAGVFIEDEELAGYYREVFELDWKLAFAPNELPRHLLTIEQDVLMGPAEVTAMQPGEFL